MNNKPSIFQVGRVQVDGATVAINGWGLGPCVPACPCHGHPIGGGLSISQNVELSTLGLRSHRRGGCDCCEPWTADELAGMVRDLDRIAAIEEIAVTDVAEVIKVITVVDAVETADAVEATEEIEGNDGVQS